MSTENTNNTSQEPGTAKNRSCNLTDYAVHCTPDYWDAVNIAITEKPLYIQQLQKIECTADEIHEAVIAFQKSFTNRTEWIKRKFLNLSDLEQYEEKLTQQHKRIFNRKRDPNDSDEVHGRYTFNECSLHASNAQIDNRHPNGQFWDGTLHTLADRTIIGWHPKWEEFFKKESDK